jgi:bile acid:Na+ symporter, BASS family
MHEFLSVVLKLTIIVFLVTAMLHIGTSLTLRQILEPLRNARLLIASIGVSYILVPLTAIAITRLIPMEQPLRTGLVLLSMTAGAEAGPKIIGAARGCIAFAVALLSIQLLVTIIYVPTVLSVLLPEVHINHGDLLLKLLALVLLPMLLGLFLKARHAAIAERINPLMQKVSTVLMFLMAVLIIILNFAEISRLIGSGAIFAGTIFVVTSFIIGYLFGGPGQDTRRTLGFMSGTRNASISLMIASQVFDDPDVLLMITLTVIMMLVILLPTAYWFGRRGVA